MIEPLRVVADIPGPVALPGGPVALDGMLAWAGAMREQLPPPMSIEDCSPIEIPVQREPGGRFHLASFSIGTFEMRDRHWINRRFPIHEAQTIGGPKVRRIAITAGPCKSYRLPLEVGYLRDSRLEWFCVGVADEIRDLLAMISHVGKKRATGKGEVLAWGVEPCEPWDEGFPVVRAGAPLRPLPVGWPGVRGDAATAYRVLTYPYWNHRAEELCAVPSWAL